MLNKNIANTQQEVTRKFNYGLAAILLIGFVTFLSTLFLFNSGIQNPILIQANTNKTVATYSDALAQQYAQPWLEQNTAEGAAIQYNDSLAMDYAQPWLEEVQQTNEFSTELGNGLSMQYAQPWMDQITPDYNDPLAMVYAEQWLETAQGANLSANELGTGLPMQYAQKWLDSLTGADCNGRLDQMYACENSSR